ncbi:hypothetical protein FA13DRAFT_1716303 [Coprinellus micaceus]|uniref:Uncharacterized protein n=1 Tax=Coprinellus micaceus TaxID=71717 RepID=A0A4Y7SJW4_COPMI|nr:hypothetical protein FA13DRAFT_1716303 [Coprinellus micaceus]
MLQTGHYHIVSKSTNTRVGRHFVEDHSLLPKKILVLPKDFSDRQPWLIIKDEGSDDTYTLRADGAAVVHIHGKLFAELLDHSPSQKAWKIQAQPHHGENTFTVVSAHDQGLGWVVPDNEPFTQLHVRPLIVAPSIPPHFPSSELFEIVRLLEDSD